MCVIAIVEEVRLTDDQVDLMYEANKFGGGVAWRDIDEETGEWVVKWRKGLLKDDMIKMNRELPLPYVLHFRVPSAGTSSSPLACHPFAVDDNATVAFEGKTEGFVLFHNGFWHDWKTKLQHIAISGAVRVPTGPWSDSRGLAWAANHLGLGFLEFVDEKVVAFGPGVDDIEVFGKWDHIKNTDPTDNEDKIILVSNRGWERTTTSYYTGTHNRGYSSVDHRRTGAMGTSSSSSSEQAGGTAHQASFSDKTFGPSSKVGAGTDDKKSVQEATEGHSHSHGQRTEKTEEAASVGIVAGGSAVAGPLAKDRRCVKCRKLTQAGAILGADFHCWQCWSACSREEIDKVASSKGFVGLCHICKAQYGGAKTVKEQRWICLPCWETNGSPKVIWVAREVSSGKAH